MQTITLREVSEKWADFKVGVYGWTDAGAGYLFLVTFVDSNDWTVYTTTGARFYCTPCSTAYIFDNEEERAWFTERMTDNLRLNREAVREANRHANN